MAWIDRSVISRLLGERAPHGPESITDDVAQVFNAIGKDAWTHVPTQDMGIGGQIVSPHIGELSSFLDRYNEAPKWFKIKQLDWLLADALCYAEVNQTMHTWRYPKWTRSGKFRWGKLALKVGAFVLTWGIWLAILGFLSTISGWWIGIWVTLTILNVGFGIRSKIKRDKLMVSMIDAYHTLDSIHPSWSNTWNSLQKSKDLGAKWPTPLLRLVEDKSRGHHA
ncbi:hypothetical protein [Xanthomonas arboricola]|uniref:hypothetical protein n=1 Tax=Xanthomonas arboricola TaxID=56448 RepID=UPI000CEE002B|nr:hypothetical protein [Xanthomonas arboricola]MCC4614405.1 hypothetical protein [Xanthomonas campestris pv. esculenti]CAD2259705.1 hypothetical protein X12_002722 [Xanthomonas arboricola]